MYIISNIVPKSISNISSMIQQIHNVENNKNYLSIFLWLVETQVLK